MVCDEQLTQARQSWECCSCGQRLMPAMATNGRDVSACDEGDRPARSQQRWRLRMDLEVWLMVVFVLLHLCLPVQSALSFTFPYGSVQSLDDRDVPGQCNHSQADSTTAPCTEPSRGALACSDCNPGEWCHPLNSNTSSSGSIGSDEANASFVCEPCPAGCFQNAPGQHHCYVCHGGNFSDTCGKTRCSECMPGLHSDKDNQPHITCDECEPGQNQSRPANASCYPCPPNTICQKPACAHCAPCPKGNDAAPNHTECVQCQPGFDNPGGPSCQQCNPGYVCNMTGCEACEPCLAGSAMRFPGQQHCVLCARGHFQDKMGQTHCERCQHGYFAAALGSELCNICTQGFYCPNPDNEPQSCPDNAYCPQGSVEPHYCPAMFELNANTDGCAMSGGLIGVIAATIIVNIIIVTAVIWHYYRKKRLYTGETQPLVWRKETLSRDAPVYDGF